MAPLGHVIHHLFLTSQTDRELAPRQFAVLCKHVVMSREKFRFIILFGKVDGCACIDDGDEATEVCVFRTHCCGVLFTSHPPTGTPPAAAAVSGCANINFRFSSLSLCLVFLQVVHQALLEDTVTDNRH